MPSKDSIHTSTKFGKYLISPLTISAPCGRSVAAVSIRSGQGTMTHDRIVSFTELFDSPQAAARFVTRAAIVWIGEFGAPPSSASTAA